MASAWDTDVLIAGAGVGGCAAALAVAVSGRRAILTEETDWIGGQFTSQLVPPDEHGWIEKFGRTANYRRLRDGVRDYYRRHYPLTEAARADPLLNPGNGWVSPLCHEPRVALAVIEALLAPHVSSGRVLIWRRHAVVAATLSGKDRVSAVTVRDLVTGAEASVSAAFFLDGTELGDLLPLAGAEFVTGQESRTQTGEPSAPVEARPDNVQAFSLCFAMEHRDGENHVGPPPADYDSWRRYVAPLTPPWPGPWLGWDGLNPRTMERMQYRFHPHGEKPGLFAGLWSYRRIIDRTLFVPGAYASDIVVVNWPMIDYLPGNLIGASAEARARSLAGARQLSLSAFHWLQTEAPRPDGGRGWPGLRLCPGIAGTADGLAQAAYIRESRRIRAECTIREQDVSAEHLPAGADRARQFADSVGLGYYRIDLHPSHQGDNYIDVPSLPFQIPLGALIPVRMENLLPAAKNIGTTHLTNGCYRLHPVEWNIGEAAGQLAAFCLDEKTSPRAVHARPELREKFQSRLIAAGFELEWPKKLVLAEGDPHAHAMKS